jgi:hypothetical protein
MWRLARSSIGLTQAEQKEIIQAFQLTGSCDEGQIERDRFGYRPPRVRWMRLEDRHRRQQSAGQCRAW